MSTTQVYVPSSAVFLKLVLVQGDLHKIPSRKKLVLHLVQVEESVHSAQLIGQLRHPTWLSSLNKPIGHGWHELGPDLLLKNLGLQTRQTVSLEHVSQFAGHGWQAWEESTKEFAGLQAAAQTGFLAASAVTV